jgi:hypothetical protein
MADETTDGPWGYVNDRGKWLEARMPGGPDQRVLEAGLNEAWSDLLRRHMPFHEPSESERARLFDLLREVEEPPPVRDSLTKKVTRILVAEEDSALKKLRLIEQAHHILRLDRYANAPANRGWMNLFRAWAGEEDVDAAFEAKRRHMPLGFVQFYEDILWQYRASTIDASPVPHPWDADIDPKRDHEGPETPETPKRAERMDERRRYWKPFYDYFEIKMPRRRRLTPGVFLDSGIIEGRYDYSASTSADERASDAAGGRTDDPHGGEPAGSDTNP